MKISTLGILCFIGIPVCTTFAHHDETSSETLFQDDQKYWNRVLTHGLQVESLSLPPVTSQPVSPPLTTAPVIPALTTAPVTPLTTTAPVIPPLTTSPVTPPPVTPPPVTPPPTTAPVIPALTTAPVTPPPVTPPPVTPPTTTAPVIPPLTTSPVTPLPFTPPPVTPPTTTAPVIPPLTTCQNHDSCEDEMVCRDGFCKKVERIEWLANLHAPIIYFHPDEQFFPSSVDYFFGLTDDATCNYETIFPYPGCEDGGDECVPSVPYLLEKGLGGQDPSQYIPVYAIAVPIDDGIIDIVYSVFFPYNLGKEGGTFVCPSRYEDHVGDWEFLVIRLIDESPTEILLSHHSDTGASAANWDAFDFPSKPWERPDFRVEISEKQPIVYCAKGSHGFWGSSGSHTYREATFANFDLQDETGQGVRWDTGSSVEFIKWNPIGEYDEPYNWLNFKGRWGNTGSYNGGFLGIIGVECPDIYGTGPTGPAYKRYLDPTHEGLVLYEQRELGDFHQDRILECPEDVNRLPTTEDRSINLKSRDCNDKINGIVLQNVAAGTRITFFNDVDGDDDGELGFGDNVKVTVKKRVLSFHLGSLESGGYNDDFIEVESEGDDINGKISVIQFEHIDL